MKKIKNNLKIQEIKKYLEVNGNTSGFIYIYTIDSLLYLHQPKGKVDIIESICDLNVVVQCCEGYPS